MTMKILFITPNAFGRGGPGTWLENLTKALNERGHEVHVLTWDYGEKDGLPRPLHRHAVVHRIPARFFAGLGIFCGTIFSVLPVLGIVTLVACRIIKSNRIDVMHCDSIHYGLAAALTKKITNKPFVVTIQGYYPLEIQTWFRGFGVKADLRIFNSLEEMTLREVDAITVPSRWLGDSLKNRLGRKTFIRIPNGAILPTPLPYLIARRKFGVSSEKKLVVSVTGFNVPQKVLGVELLLRAVPRILEAHPECVFMIAGAGRYLEQVEQRAHGLPVLFLGHRSDVADLIAAADVFVHATRLEAFGISVLEAMSLGKPIVATNTGGIPEMVADDETGLLSGLSAESLAENILRLMNDAHLARDLADNAQRRAQMDFSWDKIAEKFEAVYARIMTTSVHDTREHNDCVVNRRDPTRQINPSKAGIR